MLRYIQKKKRVHRLSLFSLLYFSILRALRCCIVDEQKDSIEKYGRPSKVHTKKVNYSYTAETRIKLKMKNVLASIPIYCFALIVNEYCFLNVLFCSSFLIILLPLLFCHRYCCRLVVFLK